MARERPRWSGVGAHPAHAAARDQSLRGLRALEKWKGGNVGSRCRQHPCGRGPEPVALPGEQGGSTPAPQRGNAGSRRGTEPSEAIEADALRYTLAAPRRGDAQVSISIELESAGCAAGAHQEPSAGLHAVLAEGKPDALEGNVYRFPTAWTSGWSVESTDNASLWPKNCGSPVSGSRSCPACPRLRAECRGSPEEHVRILVPAS